MTCCGSCLKVSGYILVALVAVYAYFYAECQRESQEKEEANKNVLKEEFKPEETDVKDVPLNFCRHGESITTDLGFWIMFGSSLPCPLVKLVSFLSTSKSQSERKADDQFVEQKVTVYDARKNSPGSFHETGFTLVELENDPETTDWRSNAQSDDNADITKFHKQMEPHIKALYPNVKKIIWSINVVRGGDKLMDQPKAVGSPHLDYHQNKTARVEFHQEFPALDYGYSEPKILMGDLDDEGNTFGVMLGVWKPIHPAAVCDHPLAVMDGKTFHPDNQTPNYLHMNLLYFTFHNFNGAISYSPDQKWFYYPFQTTKEVLIFHHYSNGKWLANPHTSFHNKNCPEGSESRMSVELRVALFF